MLSPFPYGQGTQKNTNINITKIIVITAMPQRTKAGGIVPIMLRTFSDRSST